MYYKVSDKLAAQLIQFAFATALWSSRIKPEPQSHSLSPVTFSSDEDVDLAFSRLSAFVTKAIEDANFSGLQRAAIERANSSKMLPKSEEIVPIIKAADSFQKLCTLLANTPY